MRDALEVQMLVLTEYLIVCLFNHVVNTVQEFQIADKLDGQAYDGASVMSTHI
jgi:hypothetical protein